MAAGAGEGAAAPHLAGGIVVAHPHPLYGGTMAQPVVHRGGAGLQEQGFGSLRFNFRGVGRSGGQYSGAEEHRDVEAALAFLRGRLTARQGRRSRLGLAGYSFGSRMAALAAGAGTVPVDATGSDRLGGRMGRVTGGNARRLSGVPGPRAGSVRRAGRSRSAACGGKTLQRLGIDFRLAVVTGTGHFFEHRQRK